MIDLGSDSYSQPTDKMREVMAKAEVGCDLMKEDPTVNKLQEIVATITGKIIYNKRSLAVHFVSAIRSSSLERGKFLYMGSIPQLNPEP